MTIKLTKGYTLLEAIIYITILTIFFFVIFNSLISFTKPYKEVLAIRTVDKSGLDSLERITREVRSATTVDVANSVFGTSPGVLTLTSVSGAFSTTTKFYLDNGVLKVDVNNIYEGPITSTSASTTSLVFNHMTNSNSSAIKVSLTVQALVGSIIKTKTFYSTVILKGE